MVRLYVKRGDENLFLFDTVVNEDVTTVTQEITAIYNGRLKIQRLCYNIEDLANHGIMLPSEMIGLTDEQIEELKLKDTWAEKCYPSGGFDINKDQLGRRNGQQPKENMRAILKKAVEDARGAIDKKLVITNNPMTLKIVEEAINLLRGAVTIVYPMQLPPHDVIRMEFSNTEELAGTQASMEVIEPAKAQLWFAGHQMIPGKKLSDYIGTNDKSKVLVKLNKLGEGPPGREAVFNEEVRKQMMAESFRRQEELKIRFTDCYMCPLKLALNDEHARLHYPLHGEHICQHLYHTWRHVHSKNEVCFTANNRFARKHGLTWRTSTPMNMTKSIGKVTFLLK